MTASGCLAEASGVTNKPLKRQHIVAPWWCFLTAIYGGICRGLLREMSCPGGAPGRRQPGWRSIPKGSGSGCMKMPHNPPVVLRFHRSIIWFMTILSSRDFDNMGRTPLFVGALFGSPWVPNRPPFDLERFGKESLGAEFWRGGADPSFQVCAYEARRFTRSGPFALRDAETRS